MTDAPDSVERLLSILESWCERSETHHEECGCQMARRFREAFAAERERYSDLHDKLHAERRAHDSARERYAKLEAELQRIKRVNCEHEWDGLTCIHCGGMIP